MNALAGILGPFLGHLDRGKVAENDGALFTLVGGQSGQGGARVSRDWAYRPAVPSVKGQRPRIACGVQIPRQGHDLGIGRGLSDDGVLKMNEFKVNMHGP